MDMLYLVMFREMEGEIKERAVKGMCIKGNFVFHETESRPITSLIPQRQLWLYRHVARYPEADSTCQVVSERGNLT